MSRERYPLRPSDLAAGALAAVMASAVSGLLAAAVAWAGLRRALARPRCAPADCPCPRLPAGHGSGTGRHGRRAGR